MQARSKVKPPRLYCPGAAIAIIGLVGINFIAASAGKKRLTGRPGRRAAGPLRRDIGHN